MTKSSFTLPVSDIVSKSEFSGMVIQDYCHVVAVLFECPTLDGNRRRRRTHSNELR